MTKKYTYFKPDAVNPAITLFGHTNCYENTRSSALSEIPFYQAFHDVFHGDFENDIKKHINDGNILGDAKREKIYGDWLYTQSVLKQYCGSNNWLQQPMVNNYYQQTDLELGEKINKLIRLEPRNSTLNKTIPSSIRALYIRPFDTTRTKIGITYNLFDRLRKYSRYTSTGNQFIFVVLGYDKKIEWLERTILYSLRNQGHIYLNENGNNSEWTDLPINEIIIEVKKLMEVLNNDEIVCAELGKGFLPYISTKQSNCTLGFPVSDVKRDPHFLLPEFNYNKNCFDSKSNLRKTKLYIESNPEINYIHNYNYTNELFEKQ